ncbi:M50 family metallopeptidase [Bacillus dakarensis]|uniref:M50 family metallopeptidase n=1 Tax=Robertmurraya dakarensis TaxID=1926278 RepID=UPI000980D976|nr:M50 family metallopeptidase [Bacillus dakarensis]
MKEKFSSKFVVFIILTLILVNIPIFGNYIKIINTVIHESGHALMALFGGKVQHISLFLNTEGVTYTSHSGWFGGFLTGVSGYVFSSFFAFLAFWLISRKKYKVFIVILLVFISGNLIFWVRNFYGIFWLVSFGALFLLLLYKGSGAFVQYFLLFIASVLMVESISSSYTIMLLSFIQPLAAGDATGLARATFFIPAQLWGIFFFCQALVFFLAGLKAGAYRVE